MSIKVGGLEVNLGGGYRWSGNGVHEITDLTGDSDSESDDEPAFRQSSAGPPVQVPRAPPSEPPPPQPTNDYPSTAGEDGDPALQDYREDRIRMAAELFTSDLKPSLTCPICFEVPIDIRRCNVGCGKCICDPCAREWFGFKKACPSCNVSTTYEGLIVGGGPMFNEILSMESMDCPNKARGCNFNGKVNMVELHRPTCQYGVVSCAASACPARLLRRDMEEHTGQFCRFSPVPCPYCREDIFRKDLTEHSDNCMEGPRTCNHCRREMTLRQLGHHAEVCPRRPISCRFCQGTVAEEDYSTHIMGNHGDDLPALLFQLDELESECHRLRFQVRSLQESSSAPPAPPAAVPRAVPVAAAQLQASSRNNSRPKMARHIKIPLKVAASQSGDRCAFTCTIFSSSFLGEAQVMAKEGTIFGFGWKKRPKAGGAVNQVVDLKLHVDGTPTPDRMAVWSGVDAGAEAAFTKLWEGCVTQANMKKLNMVIPESEQKWKLKFEVSNGYQ